MEREHGNARAALDWCQRHPQPDGVAWALRLCAAVARYWWLRGYLTEGAWSAYGTCSAWCAPLPRSRHRRWLRRTP